MKPTRWFWVRHAEKDPNFAQTEDPPIKPILEPIRHCLPEKAIWLSSPLRRARDTATALGAPHDLELVREFREQHLGEWEARNWSDVEHDHPIAYGLFWQDPVNNAPPGGESFRALYERVKQKIHLMNRFRGDIIIVSHAGPIRAALALALGLERRLDKVFAIEVPYLHQVQLDFFSESNWAVHLGRNVRA